MSSYGPPTEDTAIFDTIYFKQGEEFLTQNQADRRYLRFPNAQGTENLAAINVNGDANFNNPIEMTGILANRLIDMNNGEIHQCSLIHSQVNNDITIESKGTGSVVLETAATPRFTLDVGGNILLQGGLQYTLATNTITNATWSGNVTSTDTATNATFYPTFVQSENSEPLRIDKTANPLTYNPSTSTLTSTNFNGTASTATNANNVLVTSDNTSGTYYIPFSKTSGTGNKALFQDDTTGPLSYDPSTATLTYNYENIGNPFLFDEFTSFLQLSGPFGWFPSVSTLGAGRAVYSGALDSGQGTKLTSRLGILNFFTGANNNSDNFICSGERIIRPVQVKSITWGFVDCGTGTLASFTTPSSTNVTKSFGCYNTTTPNADDTDLGGIIWRRSSANSTAQNWEFRVNNVLVSNGTGPETNVCNHCRITIEFQLSGGNYQTRGIFVNLNNGSSFTSDWVNVPTNPTTGDSALVLGQHLRNNGDASARVLGIDYCLLQNASRAINRGTDNTITR